MARYSLLRGNLRGGSDDVAGRWYIIDRDGDAIDKRGRGFATRREALDSLVEQLWDDDLVSNAEIAQRAGTTVNTVNSWRRRHADTFPAPLVTLAAGPVWDWSSVSDWLARPRPAGRPRVSSE